MLRETEEDAKNPFSVEERKAHIIQELAQEGYEHHKEYCIISVPNITHITYGRDVGYKIEQEHLGEEVAKKKKGKNKDGKLVGIFVIIKL